MSAWFILAAVISFSSVASTPWDRLIERELQALHVDPVKSLNKLPHKEGFSHDWFSPSQISSRAYVSIKEGCRQSQSPLKSPWRRNDQAQNLVDNPSSMIKKIADMHPRLLEGQSDVIPWSDDYWPIAEGVIARRYQDPEWPDGTWKEIKTYFDSHPADKLITQKLISRLSPAEKWDLLLNDSDYTMTKYMWKEGEQYWAEYGEVERWMGLCHGWAPGSFMLPEPRVGIEISNGEVDIPFTVSDLKALGTNLYSRGEFETKFIGGRCSSKEPTFDENGRAIEDDCADTNAGTWHLVVVNQLGVSKRPFVLDATFDYQVWNQPAFRYKYKYFNPQTKKPTQELKEALIPLTEFKDDLFKKYRSPKAKSVVGISMQLSYGVENSPSPDDYQESLSRTVYYMYDLEIDEQGQIVGGEWYNNNHPDFLWVPAPQTVIQTPGDAYLGSYQWHSYKDTTAEVKRAAKYNAQNGNVLRVVVEKLFQLSRPDKNE